MGKISENSYIVIQAFMVRDLKLKGLELLLYAIIFGFSQAEDQKYTGSLQYLADWTNSTKRSVMNGLKSLVEQDLILKDETYVNGVKFVSYAVNLFHPYGKNFTGGKLFSPNNIDTSIDILTNLSNTDSSIAIDESKRKKEKRKKEGFVPPTLEEVEEYVRQRNSSVDPQQFLDYFSVSGWIDSKGNPVRNWKQKLITWENGNGRKRNNGDASKGTKKQFSIHYDNE